MSTGYALLDDNSEIPIEEGGTGAKDVAAARVNLGLGTAATQAITAFLQAVNNLSDVVSAATARSNLGLGTAATHAVTELLLVANNLADLASASSSRSNLGLGTASTHPATDFLQVVNNLSDITNATTARLNLGLGSASTKSTTDFLQAINNLSDIISAATARTNLGLGTAALQADTYFLQTNNNFSDVPNKPLAISNLGLTADVATTTAYSSGDISIGTSNDGSFVDVDATNAKITFTVSVTGKWIVFCNFALSTSSVISLSPSSTTLFRLTDGTNNSSPIEPASVAPLNLGLVTSQSSPQTLMNVFTFSSTGSKSVKLQKQNLTSTNIGSRSVLANANSPITMMAYRISN